MFFFSLSCGYCSHSNWSGHEKLHCTFKSCQQLHNSKSCLPARKLATCASKQCTLVLNSDPWPPPNPHQLAQNTDLLSLTPRLWQALSSFPHWTEGNHHYRMHTWAATIIARCLLALHMWPSEWGRSWVSSKLTKDFSTTGILCD